MSWEADGGREWENGTEERVGGSTIPDAPLDASSSWPPLPPRHSPELEATQPGGRAAPRHSRLETLLVPPPGGDLLSEVTEATLMRLCGVSQGGYRR